MPNGFTADIYDGKDVSLRDFLMQAGRGMGFAIMQRDDDPRDPVKLREPSDYYIRQVADLVDEANRLAGMTPEQAQAEALEAYRERERTYKESVAAQEAMRARYDAMIEKVEAWDPGEAEHVKSVKEFALRMLRESKEFDCPDRDPWPGKPSPEEYVPETWLAAKKSENARALAYAREHMREEFDRVRDFNEAILEFYEALPDA